MLNTEDATWEGAFQRGGLAVFSAYLFAFVGLLDQQTTSP
jgi:hypothetical protein